MPVIVDSVNSKRLGELTSFRQMLSDDYLTNTQHIQTEFIIEKFFDKNLLQGQSFSTNPRTRRLALLNISTSLPSLISDKFANYVGQPQLPKHLQVDLGQFTSAMIWGGVAVFNLKKVDNEMKIQFQSPDGYVLNEDGSEELITYIIDIDGNQTVASIGASIKRYILKQTYTPGKIVNELFRVISDSRSSTSIFDDESSGFPIKGNKVPLTTLAITQDIPPEESTGLSRNPIVTANNAKRKTFNVGTSDIRQVRSLISSIEIALVNMQDQLLKHMQAKLAVPTSKMAIRSDGKVDMSFMEVIGMEAGDTVPQYISNMNPLMGETFRYIEGLTRQISAVVSLPVEFMGLKETGGAESEGTKSIRMSDFLKKVKFIRSRMERAFEEINDVYEEWFGAAQEEFFVDFGPVFATDKQRQVDELQVALDSGVISQLRAIMRYQNIDEDEAQQEIDKINLGNATINVDNLTV